MLVPNAVPLAPTFEVTASSVVVSKLCRVAPLVKVVVLELSTACTVNPPGVPTNSRSGKKRRLVLLESSKPAVVDTAVLLTLNQVLPSVLYCHVPCVLLLAASATTTMPASVLAVEPPVWVSVVSTNFADKRLFTVAPAPGVALSALARVTAPAVKLGASFTALTTTLAVAVAVE